MSFELYFKKLIFAPFSNHNALRRLKNISISHYEETPLLFTIDMTVNDLMDQFPQESGHSITVADRKSVV